jgi:GPI ethanolamine phosphate transferase 3 subunit O
MKKTDWDLLIAHFLGVDHCGHKHGPMHQEMARKLSEMNEVIEKISHTMDDDTVLLVMGDHGMTVTGDHGGASADETEALLFAYSKQKHLVPTHYDDNVNVMQQIDLAPTLAAILGVPVPFSNLGKLNLQLLPDVTVEGFQRHQLLVRHLWQNAKQIKNYFDQYSDKNAKTFAFEVLDEFESKFEVLEHRVNSLYTDEGFQNFAKDLKVHLDNLLELCRNIWIKFNPQLMTQGMLITFLGIFVMFIIIYNVPLQDFPKIFNKQIIIFASSSSFAAGSLGYLLHNELGWDDKVIAALFVTSMWNCLIYVYIILNNWFQIVEQMSSLKKFVSIVPRISFSFSVLVFFSNSFIVNEQKILSYLLAAQVVYVIYELRKTTAIVDFKGKLRPILVAKSTFSKIVLTSLSIVILLRLSHNYFKCREEQGDCWQLMAIAEAEDKDKSKMELIPVVVLAILITIARIFLKASGNLTGYSLHVLVTKFCPTLSVIAACGHLVLSQNHLTKAIVPQLHLDTLAWVVYAIFAIELVVIVISPLLVHIVPRNSNEVSVSNYSNMIPELFKHVKNVFNRGPRSGSIPIIYGLATVYSSVFIALAALFAVVAALLLGVKVSNGLVITVAVGIGILFMYSVLRYESTSNVKECLQPHFSLVVSWFLLVNFGFYATSHQPTISQIDWNAAFVGRTANFDNSNVLSAILVLLSTFNANFLLLTIYPLLVLFPFMIYAVYPQLSMKIFMMDKKSKEEKTSDYRRITLSNTEDEEASGSSNRIDFDVTRGEINLFENEKLFMASVFKVGCQLLILQSVKVMASMIACTILCRHLMVWKIFAPRFIYEGISSYVSFIAIILGYMILMRVHVSVKSLVDKINKSS